MKEVAQFAASVVLAAILFALGYYVMELRTDNLVLIAEVHRLQADQAHDAAIATNAAIVAADEARKLVPDCPAVDNHPDRPMAVGWHFEPVCGQFALDLLRLSLTSFTNGDGELCEPMYDWAALSVEGLMCKGGGDEPTPR